MLGVELHGPSVEAVSAHGYYRTSDGRQANLSIQEMSCRCGCGLWQITQDLVDGFQTMRDKLGPINIVSGVRCREHNDRVSGAPNSKHMPNRFGLGEAFDPASAYSSQHEFLTALRVPQFSGLGVGLRKSHMDTHRRNGRPLVTWTYDINPTQSAEQLAVDALVAAFNERTTA